MPELTIEFNCDFVENNNDQNNSRNVIDEPSADFSFKFIYDIFEIRFC